MSHWVRKLFPISEMLRNTHETKEERRGGTPQYRRTKLLKLDRQMTSETAEQVNTVD